MDAIGGSATGLLSFAHAFPCCPGATAFTLLSLKGPGPPLSLLGGASALLTPDLLTVVVLADASTSQVVLDGLGLGETQPIVVPPNPGLPGLPIWVCGAVQDSATGAFVTTSLPELFLL